jgi:hypothetical protein
MSFRLFSRQLEVNHSLWGFLTIFITANRSILSADISHFKVDKDKDKYFKREKSDVHTDLHITIDQVCGSLRPSANAPAPTPLNIPLLPSAACCLLCPLSSDILYPLPSVRTDTHSFNPHPHSHLTHLAISSISYHVMSGHLRVISRRQDFRRGRNNEDQSRHTARVDIQHHGQGHQQGQQRL